MKMLHVRQYQCGIAGELLWERGIINATTAKHDIAGRLQSYGCEFIPKFAKETPLLCCFITCNITRVWLSTLYYIEEVFPTLQVTWILCTWNPQGWICYASTFENLGFLPIVPIVHSTAGSKFLPNCLYTAFGMGYFQRQVTQKQTALGKRRFF